MKTVPFTESDNNNHQKKSKPADLKDEKVCGLISHSQLQLWATCEFKLWPAVPIKNKVN